MVFKFPKLLTSYTEWLEKQQSSILSAASIILVANIVSGLSGLLRTRLLISLFFDTPESQGAYQAFKLAFQIPDAMFQLIILGAVSSAFIPIFTYYRKQSDEEAFRVTSSMMNILLSIFLVVGAVVFVFAEPFTRWRTGVEVSPEEVKIAANLTRIMLGAQFFFAISNFMTGILQSYQRFVIPALSSIIYNFGILLGAYLFAPQLGIYSTGVGVLLCAFLHMAIQLPTVHKLGYRYSFTFNLNHEGVQKMLRLTPPRILTVGINQFQQLAFGYLATSATRLAFVILDLATTIIVVPIRFFGVPIAQAAFPFLAEEASKENELYSFRDLLLKLIHQISFFAFPASVLILILRVPIVRLVFGTPNFPWRTTLDTASVVGIISVSIAAQAIVQLLIRAFYALRNTKIPFYITLMTAAIYLGISAFSVFVVKQGLVGIAISTTVSSILEMLFFLYFLDLRLPGLFRKAFWVPQIKMVTASFLMAVFLYLPFKILDELIFNTTRTVELVMLTVITSTIGMLVYIYFAALFDVRELYILRQLMDKLGTWKKTLARSPEVLLETSSETDEV